MQKKILSFFSLFIFLNAFSQEHILNGVITDAKTGKELPFVSITFNGKASGTTSDIDGFFKLKSTEPIRFVDFSFVGYEQLRYSVPDGANRISVQLKQKDYILKEVVIHAGENPAHIVIRKLQQNKRKNNPRDYNTYQYESYSKMIFTANADSIKTNSVTDSSKIRAEAFLNKQHLFMIEQAANHKYKSPEKVVDEIIGTRVSGLANPSFLTLFSQLNSLGFYDDIITISDKDYINPIATGTFSKYLFLIEDTLYENNDSIFIISYTPRKNTNFDALKGLLYIHTNGYALSSVIAQPAIDSKNGTTLKLHQNYSYQNKYWFPSQLNTEMLMKGASINGAPLMGIGHTYISKVQVNETISKKELKNVGLELVNSIGKSDTAFWNSRRMEKFDRKDSATFYVLDSIGKKEKFDQKIKIFEALVTNRIRWGKIDFDLDKFIVFNDYEGFRLGTSINTNEKLIKWASIGGYAAYGFKDKAFKYGGNMMLWGKREVLGIKLIYEQDLIESGGTNWLSKKSFLGNGEDLRQLMLTRMDSIQKMEAGVVYNGIRYLKTLLYVSKQYRVATGGYNFTEDAGNAVQIKTTIFNITEAGIKCKYAYGQKTMKAAFFSSEEPTKKPVLWVNIAKGMGWFKGEYSYERYEAKIEKKHTIKFFGNANICLTAGYINGNLPYTLLYNGNGSYKNFSISVMNSFETMGMNEFAANKYTALFLTHDFNHLLFKAKHFSPTLGLKFNAGFGQLNNSAQHEGIDVKSFNKGYYEGGILVNSILKSFLSSFGIGVFYRMGPYASLTKKDNFVFKLSVGMSF